MGDFLIKLDETAIRELTHDPRSEVARRMLASAGDIVERGARRRVPVRTGHLYDSVGHVLGSDATGPYARVYADWYDTFLEKPAKQIRHARRSLRSALRDIPKLL